MPSECVDNVASRSPNTCMLIHLRRQALDTTGRGSRGRYTHAQRTAFSSRCLCRGRRASGGRPLLSVLAPPRPLPLPLPLPAPRPPREPPRALPYMDPYLGGARSTQKPWTRATMRNKADNNATPTHCLRCRGTPNTSPHASHEANTASKPHYGGPQFTSMQSQAKPTHSRIARLLLSCNRWVSSKNR